MSAEEIILGELNPFWAVNTTHWKIVGADSLHEGATRFCGNTHTAVADATKVFEKLFTSHLYAERWHLMPPNAGVHSPPLILRWGSASVPPAPVAEEKKMGKIFRVMVG